MTFRVLCLHDKDSCAPQLIYRLRNLGERLERNHGIELTFANSPLVGRKLNNQENDDGDSIPRVWYYDDTKSGLDASIFHLRQLWQRSLHSAPFHMILGVGQGAAIAAMLPFLTYGDGPDEDKKQMFEGLNGCIFIHGWDLLLENSDSPPYEEVKNLASLHVFNPTNEESEILHKRYGNNAQFCAMESHKFNGKILNAIGHFLVRCKKEHGEAATMMQTRVELAVVEQTAWNMINQSVAKNPPKSLMAMIMPDTSRGGVLVGGWLGGKDEFRSEGFIQSGGAPYPEPSERRGVSEDSS